MEWTKKNRRTVITAACITAVVLCALWVATHRDSPPETAIGTEPRSMLSAEDAFGLAAAFHAARYPELEGCEYKDRRTIPAENGYTVSFRQEGFSFLYQVTGPLGEVTPGETDYKGTIPSDGWHLPDPPGTVEPEPELPPADRPLPGGVPLEEAENWALVRTALSHAGVDENTVEAWDLGYEYDGETPMCYKVRFHALGSDYGYELGLDGKTVLAWERNTPHREDEAPEDSEEPEEDPGEPEESEAEAGDIGEALAIECALAAAEVDMGAVRRLRAARFEAADGIRYEVSFELGGRGYRYFVDAATGEVLE